MATRLLVNTTVFIITAFTKSSQTSYTHEDPTPSNFQNIYILDCSNCFIGYALNDLFDELIDQLITSLHCI